MKRLILFSAVLLFSVLFVPFSAFAHGGQPSFEIEVGEYLVDIGYDRVGIRPGEEVRFDFDLYTESGALQFAPFTAVDMSISKGEEQIFAETIENRPQYIPSLAYTFPEEGEYTLNVRYRNSEQTIAETSFPVSVTAANGYVGRAIEIGTYIVAAVLAIIGLSVIIRSFLKR